MSKFGEQPNFSVEFCLKVFKVDFPHKGIVEAGVQDILH